MFLAGLVIGLLVGVIAGKWYGGWLAILTVSRAAHRDLRRRAGLD
jgi:hypothetical protein